MNLRTLGQSDLRITPIGVGAWAIGGGKWEFGWGPQDDAESLAAIRAALDRGINWIDTAAAYGLGHSESVVGKAVKGLSKRPSIGPHGAVLPESASPGSIEEAVGEMAELKAEGKIRNIGVSNFDAQQMQRALNVAPITSLQPQYSRVARDVESSILPFASKHKLGVIVYSPMGSGLLSGAMTRERIAAFPDDDWRKTSPNFQEPLLSRNLRLVETLRSVGKRYNATLGEIAIGWTLRNPAVTGAIVGVRSAQQAIGIAGAADIKLDSNDMSDIESVLTRQAA
jgi:aryl-alcohol dehydrogenase-like predicted oxidoreductase